MFRFFTPHLKIQKNRQIIRETDERMAKYSRRGLIGNFVIFMLCMAVGTFTDQQPSIAIALSIGLLITTLLRGYLLFRFEAIYPRAPNLWRTRYFYATLLGAGWWGLIVAIETLVVGIHDEGPLLWLYTIVFFSMTANAFAPYKQFLTIYQALGLVPGAFCLLFTGETTGVIYAIVVFFFIWLLHHQCEQIADNYWDRLEANALLARKTESLEEEKRDTRATAQLHRDYMLLLKQELEELLKAKRAPRNDDTPSPEEHPVASIAPLFNSNVPQAGEKRPRLKQLHTNVSDFYKILIKEIDFEAKIFNARALLQFVIAEFASEAADKRIDIELSLSHNIPHLMQGDTARLTQIIQGMIKSAIAQLDEGTLFIDIDYVQERGKVGELHVLVNHQPNGQRTLFNAQQATGIQLNLELALAIGLAEAQDGDLNISANNQSTQLCYRAKYPSRTTATEPSSQAPEFKGKRILLIHENPRVLDNKRQELSLLGIQVTTQSQLKRALPELRKAISNNTPFNAIVFHTHADPKASADFSRTLLNQSECKLIPQVIMGPANAHTSPEFAEIAANPYVHWLNKPATLADFKLCFWHLFNSSDITPNEQNNNNIALISSTDTDSLAEYITAQGFHCHTLNTPKTALNTAEKIPMRCFVFVNADDSFMDLYPLLRQHYPTTHIIACDSADEAYKHLQNGADFFIGYEQPQAPLALYINALKS